MDAAGELRGYLNPNDRFPWELTEDDHLALLPRLRKAIWDIAECIEGIARATPDERVKEKLTRTVQDVQAGCDGIQVAQWAMEGVGPETEPAPNTTTQPTALAASSFPQPMTGRVLHAVPSTPVAPPDSTATAPGKGSPERTR
jgi:hypothetical protein